MTMKIEGKDKVFFGVNKDTSDYIYITKPTWDCDWYWSFGYLGNRNCHYHLSSYQEKDMTFKDQNGKFHFFTIKRNKCLHDCLLEDYELAPVIKNNLWQFCEQSLTIYTLKDAYEVLYSGGSNNTTHALKDVVKDSEYAAKLANETLPKLLQAFWDLISQEVKEND